MVAEISSESQRELADVRRRLDKLLELREQYGDFDASMKDAYNGLCKQEARLLGKAGKAPRSTAPSWRTGSEATAAGRCSPEAIALARELADWGVAVAPFMSRLAALAHQASDAIGESLPLAAVGLASVEESLSTVIDDLLELHGLFRDL